MTTRRMKRGWMPLVITHIYDETPDTKTFVFEDQEDGGRPFDFLPGQYLTLRFDGVQERPLVRSYTMSGSPCQKDQILITVKRVPGGMISNWMCDTLRPGMVVRARGPMGRFVIEEQDSAITVLAAGSGITPFTSILREMVSGEGMQHVQAFRLIAVFRSVEHIINRQELEAALKDPRVDAHIFLTREQAAGYYHGRPVKEDFQKILQADNLPLTNQTFMTCGPELMMDQFVAFLQHAGVPQEKIKTESFF